MPEGEHVLELKKVNITEQPSFEDPQTMVNRLIWEFFNDDGYRHSQWTGTKYGNEKAGLTILLNRLVPGMNDELFDAFDTDDLIGKKFNGIIEHRVSTKGVPFSFLAFIRPLPAGSGPAAKATTQAPPARTATAPAPAPAPAAVAGSAAARINESKERLVAMGWSKKDAAALLKAKIGDVNNADGIEMMDNATFNLCALFTELVQRGHSPEAAAGHIRMYCPNPADAESLLQLEEKIRLRAFDLELEGASPAVDEGYVDPFGEPHEVAA